MASLKSISPQFLVSDLEDSITYYREKLGFDTNIRYEDYYASVVRDGAEIHLKRSEQLPGERDHRKENEHLDAYVVVEDVETVFKEFVGLGANIWRDLEIRPWGVQDFYVEDLDGHILCFGQLDS
ncbi:MAG: VOC family protein [Pseudomonadota bacterium]